MGTLYATLFENSVHHHDRTFKAKTLIAHRTLQQHLQGTQNSPHRSQPCKRAAIAHTRQTFVTFAAMKRLFKIFLLLLITCCYANTVFEFSDNEKKTNFENETHCYVQQTNNINAEFSLTQKVPFNDLILNTSSQHNFSAHTSSLNSSWFYKKFFYPPPDKLYLLHLSLLI